MLDGVHKLIETQVAAVFELIIEKEDADEKGEFLKGFEWVLKIFGNILFLVLLGIVLFWLSAIAFSYLPESIKGMFDGTKSIGLIFVVGSYALLCLLFVLRLALLIRKFVHLYKLTELFAYEELIRTAFTSSEHSFIGIVLEALKEAFA